MDKFMSELHCTIKFREVKLNIYLNKESAAIINLIKIQLNKYEKLWRWAHIQIPKKSFSADIDKET